MASTTPPSLTPALFLTLADLEANPKLANQLAILGNTAFTRSHMMHPEKWSVPCTRFPTTQLLLDTVGDAGIMAIILDESRVGEEEVGLVETRSQGSDEVKKGKLVACAAVIPWAGGWEKEGAGTEVGYETKAVAVDEDEIYLGKGVAIKLLAYIEKYLIEKERATKGAFQGEERKVLSLWLLAAECLTGDYWRRRGYMEVRRKSWSDIWGCHKSFDMVVMKREVEFDVK
ncbi:hypothetical protein P280DRAFT_439576 [Massarina eburnea CBS 473.64]|uniref:N-acetyltransferase domain-containing protein n=1 Tax=Massarina eburnea CBS 473.64 TaxID=1395130 RepID=A0A6A6RJB6_9PLEO|nr:hypothetical protein P280DRAFT_439576 [Massarina eburnea CBS 473.64]